MNTAKIELASKVEQMWGRHRSQIGQRNHWLNHPLTRAHINIRISGDHRKDAMTYWVDKFIQGPLGRVASVGCGFGSFERSLIVAGHASSVTGYDLSASAIESARTAAEGLPINYRVADLNSISFDETYDAIFCISSVHHIQELERFFAECRKALNPGGLLFLDEYLGPSQFQLTDAALDAINDIFAILPPKYRMLLELDPPIPKIRQYRPSLEWFENNDPSEAVRSADIIPALTQHFEIVDNRPYGGSLAHLLFSGIAANFDENNEDHRTIMLLILLTEQLLEKHGILESDFAAIVAR